MSYFDYNKAIIRNTIKHKSSYSFYCNFHRMIHLGCPDFMVETNCEGCLGYVWEEKYLYVGRVK